MAEVYPDPLAISVLLPESWDLGAFEEGSNQAVFLPWKKVSFLLVFSRSCPRVTVASGTVFS